MNTPFLFCRDSFQQAWIDVVQFLQENHWEWWNIIVQITDPTLFDQDFTNKINFFKIEKELVSPKDVAYTIFPHKLYKGRGTAKQLYDKYINRMYPYTRKCPRSGWGTYFYRMVHFETENGPVNQLDNIINAINTRKKKYRAAYTIIIEKTGLETIRPLGAPCLNYIAVQVSATESISLLCIYRNHDFLERAYGNYWGLSNLLRFLASETGLQPGYLTCISSHAYVSNHKRDLKKLLEECI